MREGVDRVALCLFEHNEKAYHAAVRMMEQYGKAAIVHPTGTGKSYIAFKLIEDNPEKVVIWLSPSEYIFQDSAGKPEKERPGFSVGKRSLLYLRQTDVLHAGTAGRNSSAEACLYYTR